MRAKLAQEDRAGFDGRAVRFGVMDAYDLLIPVREHAGLPTVTEKRTGIDTQFPKDAQQGRVAEQFHRIDV
jgi:hypothetical protein